MTRSANEISGLACKAAIGAGFPPAQAQSFGDAVAVHLAADREAEVLSRALDDVSDSPILRLPLLMDDVLRMMRIAGPEMALTVQPGDEVLVLSYAALLPVGVISCEVDTEGDLPKLNLVVDPAQSTRAALPPRITAPEALVDKLSALAAKTYVPASAASRSAGAGAGDIDND